MMYRVHQLIKKTRQFSRDESGATAIEYGLLAAGISVAIVTVVFALGDVLNTAFDTILQAISGGAAAS